MSSGSGNPRRVAMVAYSTYETDNRVRRYAEALQEAGHVVEVLCVRRSLDSPVEEDMGGVKVHRIQSRLGKNERGMLAYLLPLLRFTLASGLWLAREHMRRRFAMIHVHNVPDFLVFSALIPRLFGARVILDLHDLVPEFFASKFQVSEDRLLIRLLKCVEWLSCRVAHHVIISNHLWRDRVTKRSVSPDRCSAFINYADEKVFCPRPRRRSGNGFLALYPGGLQRHQGLDVAIEAFALPQLRGREIELHIYGEGDQKETLARLIVDRGVGDRVRLFETLPRAQIVERMADADVCVVPKRAESFGGEAFSTKILEFMSLGIPVIASKTPIDSFYFNDELVAFFDSGSSEQLAKRLVEAMDNPGRRVERAKNGLQFAQVNCWGERKKDYLKLVDSLIRVGTATPFASISGSAQVTMAA